jgi:hypothetical protein
MALHAEYVNNQIAVKQGGSRPAALTSRPPVEGPWRGPPSRSL